MRNEWTDQLPSLMEGHQEAPPEGLWDAVQAGVSRPKRIWWGPWVAGLAVAAAVVLAVFLWKPASSPLPIASSQRFDVPEVPEADVPVPTLIPEEPEARMEAPVKAVYSPQKPEPRMEPEPWTDTPFEPVYPPQEPEPGVEIESSVEPEPGVEPEVWPEPELWPEEAPKPRKAGHVLVTLSSTGSLLAQNGVTSKGYGIPYNPGMLDYTPVTTKATITPQMLSRNRESTTEARHRQLFRVSLGVNYGFAPRWSLGTGVSYTILRSDYTTLSGTTEIRTTRDMYYLGVPMNLQFQLLEWKRLGLYLNAGPMVEAAVGARVETRSFVSGQAISTLVEQAPCRDWRWSLRAGAGAQLRLFRGGSLYVQPGLSWHIPGNSNMESVYTARPLAFELDFGFRFYL